MGGGTRAGVHRLGQLRQRRHGEVCTIGHALWVHNLGLYQAHYEKMVQTVDDLKALCDNTTGGVEEFDINAAVAEASQSYMEPSHAEAPGRKLVWWQQLCRGLPSPRWRRSASLSRSPPQLMCFADTCQVKKAAEAEAFDELVLAHNKFTVSVRNYTMEVSNYNDRVTNKNTALAVTIQAYESFHPVQKELSHEYDRDMVTFERFDTGAYNGRCGLTDCQVQAVCSARRSSPSSRRSSPSIPARPRLTPWTRSAPSSRRRSERGDERVGAARCEGDDLARGASAAAREWRTTKPPTNRRSLYIHTRRACF